jgi:WD40 repeat protein
MGMPVSPTAPSASVPTGPSRYHPFRLLGRGGLGEVFLARDRELGREIALKEIQACHSGSAESRERFLLEAEVTGRLEHPGVVPVYGLGSYPDGRPFYAMRVIRGDSLQQAIDRLYSDGKIDPRKRDLELRQLLGRFIVVCNAIAYAHSKGVLHRDLKPANIMLGPFGETLVVDWGLAKVLGRDESGSSASLAAGPASPEMTQEGAVLGTPAYMSPEQAAGRISELGPAADVYSLGATLYHLLTGGAPFAGLSVLQVLFAVQEGRFLAPRAVRASVPPALEAICLKAMARRPDDRYTSARVLADDLDRWLADQPVSAWKEPWTVRLRRWVARHRTLVTATAAALVVAVVGLGLSSILLGAAYDSERQAKELELGERRRAQEQEKEAVAQRKRAQKKEKEAQSQRANAERQRDEVRRSLYVSDLRLAQQAWEDAQIDRLTELLDGQRPQRTGNLDLRGFEWHYLQQRVRASQGKFPGQLSVAFNPEATKVAAVSGSTAKVWDRVTGKELLVLKGHALTVTRIAWSADGKVVATASDDQTVKLWDAVNGKELHTLRGHFDAINGLAFSPDSRWLATASNDETVRVWDVAGGNEVRQLKRGKSFASVTYSPNGRFLAGGGSQGDLALWEASSGKLIWATSPTGNTVNSLAFNTKGDLLATASMDRTVSIWDARTGKHLKSLPGHTGFVLDVAFQPGTEVVVSASADRTVRGWLPTGELFNLRGHRGRVTALAFSRDGKRLATAGDGEVFLWDLDAAQDSVPYGDHSEECTAVAFGPPGKGFVTAAGALFQPEKPGEAIVRDDAGRKVHTLSGHSRGVSAVAVSANRQWVATASFDSTVKVWDLTTGRELFTLSGHVLPVTTVAFSDDGKFLASGSGRVGTPLSLDTPGEVKLWDLEGRKPVQKFSGHTGRVTCVRFHPDGKRLFSASQDGSVRVWHLVQGRQGTVFRAGDTPLTCLAFTRDGRRLAIGGFTSGDKAGTLTRLVGVWDVATGQETLSLRGYPTYVHAIAFSPDEKRLAGGLHDNTVKLWDLATGQEILTLRGHRNRVLGVGFSPDGTRLVSAAADRTVRVWNAPR